MPRSDIALTHKANAQNNATTREAHRQRWSLILLIASLIYAFVSLLNPAQPAFGAPSGFVTRSGTQLQLNGKPFRFSGPNIYWLGLDENTGITYPSMYRVENALDTVAAMGGNVVRAHTLGVSFGCDKCIMPSRGVYNEEALRQVDAAIKAAGDRNIRLIIPLMDEYDYYHGGRKTFTDWRGLNDDDMFWTDATVISDFEQYISTLLNRTNTYTGVRYRDDPTIMAWETGNELTPTFAWTDRITRKIKQIDPNHLVIDGTYGVRAQNLTLDAVDIVSDHFYPRSTARLISDAAMAFAGNKVFYVGEYDWVSGDSLDLFLNTLESNAVAGDSYWSLFGHADNGGYVQHNDGSVSYTLHYPGETPKMRAGADSLRAHSYRMLGQSSAPARPTTPAPQIIRVSNNRILWRGAAGAASYRVERSTVGADGPWTNVCSTNCPADTTAGWLAPSAPADPVWYRLSGINADGVVGAPSTAVQNGASGTAPTTPTTPTTPTAPTTPTTTPTAPAPATVGTLGVNLNGPATTIDGEPWLSDSAARARGMTVRGGTPDEKNLQLTPQTDGDTAKMLNSVLYNADQTGMGVTMPVPNGNYQVYLWVVENYQSQSRSWSLSLEGHTADRNLGLLNVGGWAKYGPYAVTVSDGVLNIDLGHENGSPMLSGFAIYGANLRTASASQYTSYQPLVLAAGS